MADELLRALDESGDGEDAAAPEAVDVAAIEAAIPDAFASPWHPLWFAGTVTPPRPEMVLPLAVLLIAAELADNSGCVLHSALWRVCHRTAVEGVLPMLRAQGWIMTDGVTVTVLKTPSRGT